MDASLSPRLDAWNRPLRRLRLSLTDRCNLRCRYCMPEGCRAWIPSEDILSFSEIEEVVGAFTDLGVYRVHLTGGDPLLRAGVEQLVARLARNEAIDDLSMITNGVALASRAAGLQRAGLRRVTVSLDTLRPERYRDLTGTNALPAVLDGIRAALELGFQPVKLNMVVIRDTNDDELVDMMQFGRSLGVEVRFIEYMDMGGRWSREQVVSQEEIQDRLSEHYGPIRPVPRWDSAPARRFELPDGTCFGVIAPVTMPFCGHCDRGRLTADGVWHLCLHSGEGMDLRSLLRGGVSPSQIRRFVADRWSQRQVRGAERQFEIGAHTPGSPGASNTASPLQMHALGG